jgi:CheY-like chemotaxis protein
LARALVVDDDRTLRFVMTEILRQADYKPVEAENGLDALEILRNDPNFDVILSDVQMPTMDGIQLLQELQKAYPDIPVIMLSVNPKWSAEIAERGAVACLPKPFSRRQLLDTLHTTTGVELVSQPS